jgi:hypothetical protein
MKRSVPSWEEVRSRVRKFDIIHKNHGQIFKWYLLHEVFLTDSYSNLKRILTLTVVLSYYFSMFSVTSKSCGIIGVLHDMMPLWAEMSSDPSLYPPGLASTDIEYILSWENQLIDSFTHVQESKVRLLFFTLYSAMNN